MLDNVKLTMPAFSDHNTVDSIRKTDINSIKYSTVKNSQLAKSSMLNQTDDNKPVQQYVEVPGELGDENR